ncbi:hypothetical protein [Salinibius halmophilus]|uniref:hypothetical protein n=1 Tax=Salinibius halmophilus TaxID=1853216 RepID=UPI000E676558|nr:hypothetical protein [Salinibius halmophilus]
MTTKPSFELRLQVLAAIDYAPGNTIRARIKAAAERSFTDPISGQVHRFTWRTISTWLYRYKKHGVTTLDNLPRIDKHQRRKVQANELAEAIQDILPTLTTNKTGQVPKSVLYRLMIERGLFQRSQLSATSFYRMVREHQLLNSDTSAKLRLSFAMQYANELWQADTT